MSQFDVWIERLARRIRWGECLHRAAHWLAIYLLVVGGILLAGKLLVPRESWPGPLAGEYSASVRWQLGLCTSGAVLLLLVCWQLSRTSLWSRTDLVAWLDGRLHAGGLLMTLSETAEADAASPGAMAEWESRLPDSGPDWHRSMPSVWPVRFARYLVVPACFAMIACVIPWRHVHANSSLRDTVSQRETEELVELLKDLKQAGVLEEREQEKLDEEIRKLAADTRKKPLTHEKWETVDALREQMQMRLDAHGRSLDKALSAIETLESAEFDANGSLSDLDREYSDQLLDDIRDALKNTSIDKLPPSLQELARKYQRQQAGQGTKDGSSGKAGEGDGGEKPTGGQKGRKGSAENQSAGQGKTGSGEKGEGRQAGQKGRQESGRRGPGQFGLPRDPAARQQALDDLKEFLQQESEQLEQLQQQAQRNPGGT
tara:strand:- start:34 stop:1323 length:1290 start_codon:yes stop_codon:yes gene_type:complete